MTRPTTFRGGIPVVLHAVGYMPSEIAPEVPPPTDYAYGSNGGYAVTVNAPQTGGIVQTKAGIFYGAGAAITENFDATPTNGNTMYGIVFTESATNSTIDTSGWAAVVSGTGSNNEVEVWSKVAGASEPTAVHIPSNGIGGSARRLVLIEVAGAFDVSGSTTDDSATSPLTGPSITPGDDPAVLIAGFIGMVATYVGDPTWTPLGVPQVTDTFLRNPGARLVSWVGHQDTTGSGPFVPSLATTALYAGTTTASVAISTGATPTAVEWNVPAPKTVDGSDSTYHEIDGPQVLRVDIGEAIVIVSARILAGSQNAGPVAYTIIAANEADFSDAVTVASTSYTAAGSYTAEDRTVTWSTDTAYRYWQLDGTDENRRLYTFSLYDADISAGEDHDHAAIEAEIDAINTAIEPLYPLSTITPATGDVWTWGGTEWAPRENVRRITSNSSNVLTGPFVNFAAGSGVNFAASSNTLTIGSTGVGGGTIITSNGSNGLAAIVNLVAGSGIALGVSGQDITILNTGGSSSADPVQTLFGTPSTAYEFGTTSLAGLTAIGTPTTEDANTTIPGCLYYKDSTAGTAIMGRYQASPATPFTVITLVLDHAAFANHNFAGLLLGVADPTTGAIVMHEVGRLGRFLVIEKFTNRTTFSSAFSTGSTTTWAPLYLAVVVNSTTSVDYWYSMNGRTWRKSLAAHDPSMTIGSLGLGMRSENSGGHVVAFDYLRIWNSALTFPGA